MSGIKRFAKHALFASGVVGLARATAGVATFATILRYHSVSAKGLYRSPTIALSPAAFDRQMAYLAKHYNVLPLGQLLTHTLRGDIPRNGVAITFDDGYQDNIEFALPILQRYGLPATFFVASDAVLGHGAFWVGWLHQSIVTTPASLLHSITEAIVGHSDRTLSADAAFATIAHQVDTASGVDRSRLFETLQSLFPNAPKLSDPSSFMMTARDLRRLRDAGMSIGAHTATHRVLSGAPASEAVEEVIRSKRNLEDALGEPVEHFAYPNGYVDENVDEAAVQIVAAAGFLSASTSRRGVVMRDSAMHMLPRQGVNASLGFSGFAYKLEEQRLRSVRRTVARR
jgi:peptidoglycan/xylan/chitin deacetylase (PgdA/CDA1 family)